MAVWETVLLGVLVLLVLLWFGPGLGPALRRSREAPQDWRGALIPIGMVVLFVIFLITTLR